MPPETAVTEKPAHGLLAERTAPSINKRQAQVAGVRAARGSRDRLMTVTRSVLGVVILLALWQILPTTGVVSERYVIPFFKVCSTWWGLLRSGMLWQQTEPSLLRIGVGFGGAVLMGVPLGAAIAWYRSVRETVTPLLEILRNTAPLAILPVFTLVLGIGDMTKFVIVAYACTPPVVLATVTGIATVDEQLMRTARVLGLSPVATFRKVAFPAALPQIFTGIRIAGAASVLVLLAAEMVGATAGLGYFINSSEMNFQVSYMYAGIVTVTLVGLVINYSLQFLERWLSKAR